LADLELGNTDGKVYVAAQRDRSIMVFKRDSVTDMLTVVEHISEPAAPDSWKPVSLETSLDDKDVMSISSAWWQVKYDDRIYSRHYETELKQWRIEYETLGLVRDIELTPDGQQVLLALSTPTSYGGHIAVLDYHEACGELELSEAYTNGVGQIDGIWGPSEIVFSLDSAHAYVAAASNLVVFSLDSDRDGIPNASDPSTVGPVSTSCLPTTDTDGDGHPNDEDEFPNDPDEYADNDGDGTGDNADLDDDNDGVMDVADNCRLVSNPNQSNFDGDAVGNACDSDDDNDGVQDVSDAFPLDANESVDTDRDGVGNNADSDDDNDGMSDADEIARGRNPLINEVAVIMIILGSDFE
jgi:hypothetical protein